MNKELTKLNDLLQDMGEALDDINDSLKIPRPPLPTPQVTVNSPEVKPVITVQPASVAAPVITVQQKESTKWKFTVTKRDHEGLIQEFTATPIK